MRKKVTQLSALRYHIASVTVSKAYCREMYLYIYIEENLSKRILSTLMSVSLSCAVNVLMFVCLTC